MPGLRWGVRCCVPEPCSYRLQTQDQRPTQERASPRHVPDQIRAIVAVPRTLNGKKLEVPVKRILLGEDPAQVASRDTLANPEALDALVALLRA